LKNLLFAALVYFISSGNSSVIDINKNQFCKTMDYNELNDLIRNRRSVFTNMFTGESVDDEIVRQMLENANWAPTNKLTAPWSFCVFSGGGLRKLAEFQSELYKEISIKDGIFVESKYQKLQSKPLLASHIISIGMKRDSKERVPEIEEIEAVACSVQNMYLTATAYGIGCYWGSGGITYEEKAKAFFGLEVKDRLLGFLYIGVPKIKLEGKRLPIEDKVNWIR
jgi:nitroreductase